ncbi:MAG: carbamoyl-phosphate synthase (glutamine-hydrolyzing) large subunit [Promethearchaeati archaeon SRVP18_Atabeyarchaeia-1]
MPKMLDMKKVMVLGSGSIKIGEAGEFDYSGSQALKALREEGIETVLINPNIATIQTDPRIADRVYLVPVQADYVEKIIECERPDGILLGFGGQTALNCGYEAAKKGVFERYNVSVLGISIESIETADDRERFREAMIKQNISVPRSKIATSVVEAIDVAEGIGYPVMVRVAYALGGRGSGVAKNKEELTDIANRGLAQSMVRKILVEEYLGHWKEIEYEICRDNAGNCIAVCNMENFDPMGIHTGDSIVVAPSQTLNDHEYQLLRDVAFRVVRSLNIIGECNVQFALNPTSDEYRVIEINSRLSRSSALASKATGYPLAFIAAKLAIGYSLTELMNKVTKVTTACFEPAMDYIVVKIPRWDLKKFPKANRQIGTQMKSVGEVMGIGTCFEEALQKGVRMLEIGKLGLVCNRDEEERENTADLEYSLANPTDERLFKIVKALKQGFTIDKIHKLTGIDEFFLHKILGIVELERELRSTDRTQLSQDGKFPYYLRRAKEFGFSDIQVARCLGMTERDVREARKSLGIVPIVRQIDTLAAEWEAQTSYLFLTYGGIEDDLRFCSAEKRIIVIGSGTYRIGSSVEFDNSCVNTVWALKKLGVDQVVIINCNPETVSTDYDIADKLYFEELSYERVSDICDKEKPTGVIVSVGGQTPNNIALQLSLSGVHLLGTKADDIDRSEDRSKFSTLLTSLGIPQPRWMRLTDMEDAKKFCREIGYPVLVRPSYVLSGAAMRVALDEEELEIVLRLATEVSEDHPVVISKFVENAKECEVDAVCDGREVLIGAVIEHIESAGVHSGDATMTIPPTSLEDHIISTIEDYTEKIARALRICGPFNVQYLVRDSQVYVIECNLRASRSLPFVSKVTGVNLAFLATAFMLGKKLTDFDVQRRFAPPPHFGVKVPQFSFMRLDGADPILNVEMMSTGEVACIGEDLHETLLMSLCSAEVFIPTNGGKLFVSVGGRKLKEEMLPVVKAFEGAGYEIYATEHTADALRSSGVKVTTLYKVSEPERKPNVVEYITGHKLDIIINIASATTMDKYASMLDDEYVMRRKAVEFNIPVFTNLQLVRELSKAVSAQSSRKSSSRIPESGLKPLNCYVESKPWRLW